MALKQYLAQKLEQRLSPQQIQLMKLLQVPTMELDQRIKQEIEENPALEEGAEEKEEDEYDNDDDYDKDDDNDKDDDADFDISAYIDEDGSDYKTKANNTSKDDEERVIPLSGEQSFQEKMTEQLHLLDMDETQFMIADTIIGNIDESGYLNREIEAIVDDLAFSANITTTEKEVEEVLIIIQDLDPAGVGARDLKECLLIQINRKQDGDITDFMITEFEGRLELTLNGRNAPELKVSRDYEQMLRTYAEGAKTSKSDKDALQFVKQKLDGAKWFIDAIKQRQNTLLLTMNAIMNYQKEYFLTGDETNFKPMILKDIAEIVSLDISTISRVANSKYVQTGYGIFSLKYFFSESLSTDSGEEVSTREVKKILSEAIEGEKKKRPLTDEKLADLLREKGYNIARRTVAKYREQLNIPVARLRKEL